MISGLDRTIEMLDAPDVSTAVDGTAVYFVRMKHRKPSEVAEFLAQSSGSGFEIIIPDDLNNLLYIQDTPADFEAIMVALPYYDVPQQTAMLSVTIVEMEEGDAANLRIYWDAWKETLPAGLQVDLFGSVLRAGDETTRLREGAAMLNNFSPQAAAAFINYLVNRGKARVTSEPVIQLVQGEESVIEATTNYFYRALERDEDGVRTFVDAQAEEGVVLRVTPFIGTETINLQVEVEVSNLVGFGQDGQPIISSSSVSSRAVLRDGESMTLAGLKRNYEVENRSTFPILGSIPGLRYLFSRETTVTRRSEIMIYLSPSRYEPTG